ncbi:saccharopine dehydrogenase NADP-binding domain-containing protein [Nocardia sp. NPDC004711]
MIAIYGATGYTGRQIAQTLTWCGYPVMLAGRTRAGLEKLADQLGGQASVHVAALDDRGALEALAEQASVIVNCVGPFVASCRPIAEAAIAGRAHYVDISAEQLGSRWCYRDGNIRARAAGIALLPSFGFYSVLADLLAARASADLGPITEMQVAYCIDDWRPIGASLNSRFEALGHEWFEHDRSVTRTRRLFPRTSFFEFPAPTGRRRVGLYPVAEAFTIPWHIDVDRLTTRLTTSTLAPVPLGRFLPAIANTVGALMRTPARPLIERGVAVMWRGSAGGIAEEDLTRFTVAVHARGQAGTTYGWVRGRGIYDITAPIAAETASRVSRREFTATGTLTPAQVLDLDQILALDGFDLEHGATGDPSGTMS